MNVIDTSREETSEQVITIGRLYRKRPVSPFSIRKGRYATIFVMVAKTMAVASLVGPSQAATMRGWPCASRA